MENKIVRQCVQGLIDDSKLVDTLCEQLETERINLVKVITDLDSNNSSGNISKQMLENLKRDIDRACSTAEDCSSQLDYANDSASDSVGNIEECSYLVDTWISDLKKAEQQKIDNENAEQTPLNNEE